MFHKEQCLVGESCYCTLFDKSLMKVRHAIDEEESKKLIPNSKSRSSKSMNSNTNDSSISLNKEQILKSSRKVKFISWNLSENQD